MVAHALSLSIGQVASLSQRGPAQSCVDNAIKKAAMTSTFTSMHSSSIAFSQAVPLPISTAPIIAHLTSSPTSFPSISRVSLRKPSRVDFRALSMSASPPVASEAPVLPAPTPPPCPALGHHMEFKEVAGLRRALRGPRMFFRLRGRAPRKTILTVRLGGGLAEEVADGGFPFAGGDDGAPTLPSLINGLRLAAHDPRISHLYITVDRLTCGWGKILEVRRHLEYFVAAGKSVTVFMEGGGEKEYFLSCGIANCEVFLPPEGGLSLRGFSAAGSFVRGVLEKVGVTPQVERIGVFKSAGDQIGRKDMSPEQRMVIQNLLDQVQELFVSTVSTCKGMTEEEVVNLLDKGMQDMAEYAEAGLITGVKYESDVIEDLKRRFLMKPNESVEEDDEKIQKRPLSTFPLRRYVKRTTEKMLGLGGKKKIAVIRAAGAITSGKNGSSPVTGSTIGSDSIIELVNRARDDESVKAVILRVDSPGGSALASDVMFDAISKLSAKKPVIASMVSVAASGGYYMSMGQTIVCESAAITGSVGVVTAKLSLADLYKKIGFNKETLSVGKYAELEIDTRTFNRDEAAYFRAGTERAYKSFVSKAAKARGLEYDAMHEVAQGRVWTGKEALERNLVDHIGGFWKAVELAKEKAEIGADEFVKLEEIRIRQSPLARLGFGSSIVGAVSDSLGQVGSMLAGGEVLAVCDIDDGVIGTRTGSAGMQLSPLQKMSVDTVAHLTGGLQGGAAFRSVISSLFQSS